MKIGPCAKMSQTHDADVLVHFHFEVSLITSSLFMMMTTSATASFIMLPLFRVSLHARGLAVGDHRKTDVSF